MLIIIQIGDHFPYFLVGLLGCVRVEKIQVPVCRPLSAALSRHHSTFGKSGQIKSHRSARFETLARGQSCSIPMPNSRCSPVDHAWRSASRHCIGLDVGNACTQRAATSYEDGASIGKFRTPRRATAPF